MITLGMDVGGTKSKWAVAKAGVITQTGKAGPLRRHLFLESETHSFKSVCLEIRKYIRELDKVAVGITGVLKSTEQQKKANEVICEVWELSPSVVTVMSDIELAYVSQFENENGILIAAGTGSVAAFRDWSGDIKFIGGKGYLIGDEGSGFWIASEGIRRSIRFFEENSEDEILGCMIKKFFGIEGWREILPIVYSDEGRSRIASAAETVTAAAIGGSSIANEIVEFAVINLARLYDIAKRTSLSTDLRMIGGVVSNGSLVKSKLSSYLKLEIPNICTPPEIYAARSLLD